MLKPVIKLFVQKDILTNVNYLRKCLPINLKIALSYLLIFEASIFLQPWLFTEFSCLETR